MPREPSNNRPARNLAVRRDVRIRPPGHLTLQAQSLFREITDSMPAAHFRPCDVPLLACYAEIATVISQIDAHASPALFKTVCEGSKTLASLAVKLRLCPSSNNVRTTQIDAVPRKYWKPNDGEESSEEQ